MLLGLGSLVPPFGALTKDYTPRVIFDVRVRV